MKTPVSLTAAAATLGLMGGLLSPPFTAAQLAITEVMSSAATTHGATVVASGPDYWELSNFGTLPINLTGYRFNDNDGLLLRAADATPFQDLVIQPNESIVFFESQLNAVSADAFRAWWGLTSDVRVIPYTNPGFGFYANPPGDGVRLWPPTATMDADVADSVNFPSATRGRSFTYDPVTGEFGILSSNNVAKAFRAATADDVGSPGTNTGPVSLSFVAQPTNLVLNPGDAATFSARHRGLPRPTYQWWHDGVPIQGETFPVYSLDSVQSDHAGGYQVVLSNIFQVVTSSTATLTLRTNPMAPRFLVPPRDLWVFIDQDAVFRSVATGLPQPDYQWRRDGVNLPGETNRKLIVPGWHSVGTNQYSVVAHNPLGSITNDALLLVFVRPDLRITELMAWESAWLGTKHQDWWELTSFDTSVVDLYGYRFDDFSEVADQNQLPYLEFAWSLTNHVFIHPGESVVFVEDMSADAFVGWWGRSNLPPDLQIITYSGSGLGFSSVHGDGVGFWNMGATRDDDFANGEFTAVSYSELDLVRGKSFTINPDTIDNKCCYLPAEPGVLGAFVAAEAGDIGSPGYIRTPTDPRIFSITITPAGCRLTWRSALPGTYRVLCREQLTEGAWQVLATMPRAGPTTTYMDGAAGPSGISQRFYRILQEP